MERLRAVGTGILDAVFPPRCAGCRRRGYWVCDECDARLVRFGPPICVRCGIPPAVSSCRCLEFPLAIASHRSVAAYGGWLRSAIVSFKYEEERAREGHLGEELARIIPTVGLVDGLVPVPLHPKRLRDRGFNQAELLARRAAIPDHLPVMNVLVRTRPTQRQVGLGAYERAVNVHDAFAVAGGRSLNGLRLALVDDVCTTGSTLGACAEALLAHGAREVVSLTLAREI